MNGQDCGIVRSVHLGQRQTKLVRGLVQVGILPVGVTPEEITWLWPHRIMIGDVALVCGAPGSLKSTLCTDWCSRVSRAFPFPGQTAGIGGSALLAAVEDDSKKSTAWRLIAHSADLDRVYDASRIAGHAFSLPGDIPALRRICLLHPDIRIIALDPLGSCSSVPVTSPRIRGVIDELRDLAKATNTAVVVTAHLLKDGKTIAGSQELLNACRSIMVVKDGAITMVKSSYAALGQPAVFELEGDGHAAHIRYAA